jgi:hypothetical protein
MFLGILEGPLRAEFGSGTPNAPFGVGKGHLILLRGTALGRFDWVTDSLVQLQPVDG